MQECVPLPHLINLSVFLCSSGVCFACLCPMGASWSLSGWPAQITSTPTPSRVLMGTLAFSIWCGSVRALWARVVGPAAAKLLGLHGLRVAGYNGTRRKDRELAIAQGGWDPSAGGNDRYDRFSTEDVLNIPAGIVASAGDLAIQIFEPAHDDGELRTATILLIFLSQRSEPLIGIQTPPYSEFRGI